MPSTYSLISSNVLSTTAASVTFSAIPSTYTDLVLRWSARDSNNGSLSAAFYLEINSATANLSATRILGDGSTVSSGRSSLTSPARVTYYSGSTATASTFGTGEIYIPSYTANQNKPLSVVGAAESNTATGVNIEASGVLFSSTSAISSITLYPNGSNFVSGSSFYLYGIKNS